MKIVGIAHRAGTKKDGNNYEFYHYYIDVTDKAAGDEGMIVDCLYVTPQLHRTTRADGIKVGSDVLPYRTERGFLQAFVLLNK